MKKTSIFAPFKGWKYIFKKPVTVSMDDIFKNPRESQNNYRGFHVNDWDKCIGCGTCSEVCPTNAITMFERPEIPNEDGSKPERPVIDYGRCCFCGLCVDICTSGSLNLTKEYLYNSPDPDDYIYMPTDKDITGRDYKLGYVKDESSDLLDLERKHMEHVGAEERKKSFIEIVRGFSKEQAKAEAARCVECGICTKTCPAHMNIPEYIRAIWEDDLEAGLNWLYKTNPLPSVCGRICTHKCEGACAISNRGEAIAIRWLKRYIVDNMPDDEYEKVILSQQVSEKGEGKIAIVGAGSAGLSAAYYLGTLGYEVDVFERMPHAGGPMRYGAPKYRLPDDVTTHDISFIEKLGVKIHTNTEVGKDIKFKELQEKYNAVFMATGYPNTRGLKIPGVEHENVKMAMGFLAASTDYETGRGNMPEILEDVVVVGSGNVAFDVARTLIRFQEEKYGKSSVKMLALENDKQIPADIEEIEEGGEEGILFNLGYGPQKILTDESGALVGIEAVKCVQLFDENKRFNPQYDYDDVKSLECKQVYLAIGQTSDLSYVPDELSELVKIERGKIKVTDKNQVEGVPWLFAGGDIVHGMDIINGVADGHTAAVGIDSYLRAKK